MPIQIKELRVSAPGEGSAADIFLHLVTKRAGRIKGEGTTDPHVDDIVVQSWAWGVSANTAIGSTQATARRSYRNLVLTKGIDSASTGLLSALVTNDEVKQATLTMRKAGGETLEYFRMMLSGARIVDVDFEVQPNGAASERVTIAFTKVEVEYKRQEKAGLGAGSSTFSDELLPA
jgi:type VI secretion system secreted protein Hcp